MPDKSATWMTTEVPKKSRSAPVASWQVASGILVRFLWVEHQVMLSATRLLE